MNQPVDPIAKVLAGCPPESAKPLTKYTALPSRDSSDSYRVRQTLFRDWAQVEPALRRVLSGLATGKLPWPLLLHGDVGSGKTFAAICLCDATNFARFWTVRDVKDQMWANEPPWNRPWGFPDHTPSLSVLDELGTRDDDQQFEYDAVLSFLDWRDHRPAIYISNHPPATLRELYCRRIESRLVAGTVFELKGPDRRREK